MLGIASELSLGVEIHEQRLLLAEIRKRSGKIQLQKVVQAAIPSEVIGDGKVKNVDSMAQLLRETMRTHNIRCKKTHLVVPSQFVVIRQLQLPDLPKKQLSKLIDFELQNSIHLPFEDPIFDFVNLGPVKREVPTAPGEAAPLPEADITLVASSRGAIDPVVESAKRAGLQPISVDIRALALARAYQKLGQFAEDQAERTTMFVDVAESSTDLHIFTGNTLKFTRNVPMALDSYKIDHDREKPFNVLEVLEYVEANTNYRSFTQDLAYEIERSVNFFRYTLNNRDEAISRIVLTGMLPKSGIFALYLEDRLPEMVIDVLPFAQLQLHHSLQASSLNLYEYAIPIGLALKEVK